MKKLIACLAISAAAFGLATSTYAQGAGPKNQDPTKKQGVKQNARKAQREMLAKLKLTEDQKSKLKAHQEKMAAKMKALRTEVGTDKSKREAAAAKFMALRKENQEALKAILTDAQEKQLEDLRKEAAKQRQATRKKNGGGGGGRIGK